MSAGPTTSRSETGVRGVGGVSVNVTIAPVTRDWHGIDGLGCAVRWRFGEGEWVLVRLEAWM